VKPGEQQKNVILNSEGFCAVELPHKRPVLFPWLEEQSIHYIIGWRNVGKSFWALTLLESVTRGQRFGAWDVTTPVPCLFLDAEMCAQDTQDRLNQLKFSRGGSIRYMCIRIITPIIWAFRERISSTPSGAPG